VREKKVKKTNSDRLTFKKKQQHHSENEHVQKSESNAMASKASAEMRFS